VSPVYLEFSLLSIIIARNLLSDKSEVFDWQTNCNTDTDDRSNQSLSGDEESEDSNELYENTEYTDITPLTSVRTNISYSTFTLNQNTQQHRQVPLPVYVALITYIIVVCLDVTGSIMQITDHSGVFDVNQMKLVCACFIKLFMTTLLSYGFVRLNKDMFPKRPYESFKSDEYLFLFTSLGSIIQHIIELFGTMNSNNKLRWVWNIIVVYQDYLQITFLLHANRCIKRHREEQNKYLKWVCMLLVATNFGCWLEDSFILLQFPVTSFENSIYNEMSHDYKVIKSWSYISKNIMLFIKITVRE